jgi:dTDP-glucose 4,6-dehydratase
MAIIVTGGAGFIGSNFVLDWLSQSDERVINLDALTYAGNLHNLDALRGDARHVFVQGDIGDRTLLDQLLDEHRPRAVLHFAAESHVDRSIHGPGEFMRTNVQGTFTLLEAARAHWSALDCGAKNAFRFLHVSTDESMVRSRRRRRPSPRPIPTSRTARTRRARPRATTWCGPGTTPTACRC